MHRILIVDDHPLFRSAIKQLFTKTLGKVVVSEAADAQEALHLVRNQSLDLAILDISLRGRSGTDLLRELKRASADLRILVLSMFPEEQYAVRVFQSGGNGYLRKNADPREVIRAVKKILDGEEYVSDAVAQHLALEAKSDTKLPHETLSSRESQVFELLVAGKGITEIAETLKLNVTTISTYRARILEKIDTKTNADLVRYAMHHNLVQ
jgi:two-component system, NarL family, invasion response regulator UvrY